MIKIINRYTYSTIEIPDGVEHIVPYAASQIRATAIKLPETLVEIPDSAFYGCPNLKNITIPSAVETIGSSAIQGCTALQSVTIGSEGNESACTLTGIGEKAFAGCANLSEVTIHKSEPPTAPVNAFDNYSAKLTVAKGTKADYQSS